MRQPYPEMPGNKWHKETYEEHLKNKDKKDRKTSVTVSKESIPDQSGWEPDDDSGWVN